MASTIELGMRVRSHLPSLSAGCISAVPWSLRTGNTNTLISTIMTLLVVHWHVRAYVFLAPPHVRVFSKPFTMSMSLFSFTAPLLGSEVRDWEYEYAHIYYRFFGRFMLQ